MKGCTLLAQCGLCSASTGPNLQVAHETCIAVPGTKKAGMLGTLVWLCFDLLPGKQGVCSAPSAASGGAQKPSCTTPATSAVTTKPSFAVARWSVSSCRASRWRAAAASSSSGAVTARLITCAAQQSMNEGRQTHGFGAWHTFSSGAMAAALRSCIHRTSRHPDAVRHSTMPGSRQRCPDFTKGYSPWTFSSAPCCRRQVQRPHDGTVPPGCLGAPAPALIGAEALPALRSDPSTAG